MNAEMRAFFRREQAHRLLQLRFFLRRERQAFVHQQTIVRRFGAVVNDGLRAAGRDVNVLRRPGASGSGGEDERQGGVFHGFPWR